MRILTFLLLLFFTLAHKASIQEQLQSLNERIRLHQTIDKLYTSRRGQKFHPQTFTPAKDLQEIRHSQLPVQEYTDRCQITTNSSTQTFFTFQTPRHIYIAVNSEQGGNCSVYNENCELSFSVNSLLAGSLCDRDFCDHGNTVFLTSNNEIVQCSETNNFTTCTNSAKISLTSESRRLVGTVSRSKGMGSPELYIAESDGIGVINSREGRQKLKVPMEPGSQLKQFVEKHPLPLVLSDKGWLYTFDNQHYSLALTKCPFVHKQSWIHLPNPYSQHFYLISPTVIYKMEIKSQSNACYLSHTIQLTSPLEFAEDVVKIVEYQGFMMIGTQVVELSSGKVRVFRQCGDHPILSFQPMKNNYRKGLHAVSCCESNLGNPQQQVCGVVVFKVPGETQSNKNQFVVIMAALAFFILLLYFFLRPMNTTMEEDTTQNQSYKEQVSSLLQKMDMREAEKSKKETAGGVREKAGGVGEKEKMRPKSE